ncbi:MAG: CHASE2 domain-containing protein [Cyanobacteria bacterium P01_F01_bin.150]
MVDIASSVLNRYPINHWLQPLRKHLSPLFRERRICFTSVGVASGIVGLKMLGMFQSVELSALDQLIRLRLPETGDERIVIVGLDENDISEVNKYPIPDQTMADVLNIIKDQNPRVIGLDIYRDLNYEPGVEALQQIFQTTPNLVGIERIKDGINQSVAPPIELAIRDQIGFNNVLLDADNRIRRGLLYWNFDSEYRTSFGLKIALQYLEKEGIVPTSKGEELRLGSAVFHHFQPNDGGYIGADNGGYQILANFRNHSQPFITVSFTELLSGEVSPDLMMDRIVLVGSTAPSLKDVYFTSYNRGLGSQDNGPIAGVEVHAQIISQILSASLDGRPLMRVWPDWLEALWIFAWALGGATLSWYIRRPARTGASLIVFSSSLFILCYGLLLIGWWIPFVTPLVGFGVSAIAIISHIAHLEGELQKSKEFLNSVINAIPDPIFVKDKDYRWMVLNEAYCQFLGHNKAELLEKNESDVLPAHQANEFKSQDDLAFATGSEQESEGEITNAHGHTYTVATKRTIHQDSAGNLFLVGVIHDITHRKRMEEALRLTAAKLVQSNAELRQVGNNWRKIAYHDPLTGLPNRKLFQEKLIQAVEWAEGTDQIVALLFLDLDGFKAINDTEGHVVGDLLLKSVAQRLKGCLRNSDTVARLGGDEFVVILTGIPGEQVGRVAQKLLDTLVQPFVIQSKKVMVTTSVGISLYPSDGKGIETLIVEADQAMYRSKEKGKNQYTFANLDPALSSLSRADQKTMA